MIFATFAMTASYQAEEVFFRRRNSSRIARSFNDEAIRAYYPKPEPAAHVAEDVRPVDVVVTGHSKRATYGHFRTNHPRCR